MGAGASEPDVGRVAEPVVGRIQAAHQPAADLGGLAENGIALEKKLYAQEQDQERVQQARAAFQQESQQIDCRQLVFLDETWINLSMTRRYARAESCAIVREAMPAAH